MVGVLWRRSSHSKKFGWVRKGVSPRETPFRFSLPLSSRLPAERPAHRLVGPSIQPSRASARCTSTPCMASDSSVMSYRGPGAADGDTGTHSPPWYLYPRASSFRTTATRCLSMLITVRAPDIDRRPRSHAAKLAAAAMPAELPTVLIGVRVRYKVWRSNKDKQLHLLCAEGSETFDSLPMAINMGPWTGSKKRRMANSDHRTCKVHPRHLLSAPRAALCGDTSGPRSSAARLML